MANKPGLCTAGVADSRTAIYNNQDRIQRLQQHSIISSPYLYCNRHRRLITLPVTSRFSSEVLPQVYPHFSSGSCILRSSHHKQATSALFFFGNTNTKRQRGERIPDDTCHSTDGITNSIISLMIKLAAHPNRMTSAASLPGTRLNQTLLQRCTRRRQPQYVPRPTISYFDTEDQYSLLILYKNKFLWNNRP
jgi:hypothetical protein